MADGGEKTQDQAHGRGCLSEVHSDVEIVVDCVDAW